LQADMPEWTLDYTKEEEFLGWNYDTLYSALMT